MIAPNGRLGVGGGVAHTPILHQIAQTTTRLTCSQILKGG